TLEQQLAEQTSLAVEDAYRGLLAANRWRDKAAGRTTVGPNASDLIVRHGPKDVPASVASTGEQKALLVGLCLAHAELVRQMTGLSPLLLLDEVAAHLDRRRREALFLRLAQLGSQVWMTGVDAESFSGITQPSNRFLVADGVLQRAAGA
ncbi:MAG: DNA replication/repair protein RecF, partial [Beijerinckiaceae bacterium]